MTRLLEARFGLAIRQDLSREDMFGLYRDARIIPNESICFEVNCRLFETASAGSVPLTPDCGPDQNAAFSDGEEMLVYADGRDLCEKTAWLLKHPDKAEIIGRKAWKRVQREHLPVYRAHEVSGILSRLSQARATGREAAINAWLTRLERAKAGDKQYPVRHLLAQGENLAQIGDVLAGMLHLLGAPARRNTALAFCRDLLETGTGADSAICNATASACALAHGDVALARSFYVRNVRNSYLDTEGIPSGLLELCLAWAEEARLEGRAVRPGFAFHPGAGHLPACALEFLLFAKHLETRQTERLTRAQADLLAPFPAYAPYRLGLLEFLHRKSMNPAETAELGQLLVFCCRVDEGEKILAQAKIC